jgi:hypothetical protein
MIFEHPGSRIKKQQQKRRVKQNYGPTIFVAINITKLKMILFYGGGKNFGPIYKEA